MGSKQDVLKYPCFLVIPPRIIPLKQPPTTWNIFKVQCHHYIEQNWVKNHPKEFKEIEHLQKLFFLPVRFIDKEGREHNMHGEVHSGCRSFKERYGIDREELLWKLKR